MKKNIPFLVGYSVILLAGILTGWAGAQEPPPFPFQVGLRLDKEIYQSSSVPPCASVQIEGKVVLTHTGSNDLYTSYGFSGKPFLLFLVFTNPAGKEIASDKLTLRLEGEKTHAGPPRVFHDPLGNPFQVERLEVLPEGWYLESSVDDVGPLYAKLNLSECPAPGRYTVRAVIPMRTYPGDSISTNIDTGDIYAELGSSDWAGHLVSNTVAFSISVDSDGDGYYYPVGPDPLFPDGPPISDCNDGDPAIHPRADEVTCNGQDDDCNSATPDDCPPTGTLMVKADRHVVGLGSYPGSLNFPIPSLDLQVFSKANSCVSSYSFSWQNYPNIWNCGMENAAAQGSTDGAGNATISVAPGDYLVIGFYNPDGILNNGDELFLGSGAGILEASQSVKMYLHVIEKADGKRNAAKSKVIPGSELLIIEPEYVEWTGTQELYPFVFQSIGDWGITTTITPPEGFVADHGSLSAEVNSDLKSVQFVVTDIGSEWKDTKVEHKIKHHKRVHVVPSHIGVVKKQKDKEKNK